MRRVVGDSCQVRPDFVTRAKCIKVSRGTGIPKRTVTYIKVEVVNIAISWYIISFNLSIYVVSRVVPKLCNFI